MNARKRPAKTTAVIVLLITAHVTNAAAQTAALSNENRLLLEKIQKDSAQYFFEFTDPETGLTLDSSQRGAPASIAATGFALVTFAIASSHGWISYRDSYQRILKTLETLEQRAAQKNGFFYHFLDPKTAKRVWNSEASSMDTALLIAGLLLASTYFSGTELEIRSQRLYERIDWPWMLNQAHLFNHGWKPNEGFLPYYWDQYSEHLILQLLALGSRTHAIPEESWQAWERLTETYRDKEIVYAYTGSLFTYQYSHAFVDFRNLSDKGINYFDNSKKAAQANFEFSYEHREEFKTYQNFWGLSASLGPDGYKAYGAQPGLALHDGTIAPYASIASIVLTPQESISVIRLLYETYGTRLYGRYGFKDAFNLDRNWWAELYLGVDQGIVVIMLENFLNKEAPWKRFMKIPAVRRAIQRAGLTV